MNDDIDLLIEEFRKYYPVDGMVVISTVGEEDPRAPEHEYEMDCLWVGLHRRNKIKLPKRFRGFKIFTEVIGRVAA
jgi:hypothetical protein